MTAVIYQMQRGGKTVAHVAVMPNRKCIVTWPTSTIVYDNEDAARAVHITHMGGRGERTTFVPWIASKAFDRGALNAEQDRMEGCPDASGPMPPHYIPEDDREDYCAGYMACSKLMYGETYVPDASKWQGAKRAQHQRRLPQ